MEGWKDGRKDGWMVSESVEIKVWGDDGPHVVGKYNRSLKERKKWNLCGNNLPRGSLANNDVMKIILYWIEGRGQRVEGRG